MDARTLIMKVAEYIADHAEQDSKFLYPEHLRARWVEVTGLMEFMCGAAEVAIKDVNKHLDEIGK